MIRSVLPLGSIAAQNQRGSSSKLLELADKDDRQDEEAPPTTSASTDQEDAEEDLPPIASVITQVSATEAAKTSTSRLPEEDPELRNNWRAKVRQVF